MRRLARAFSACLRVEIASSLQYRAEIVLWATWGLVNPAVLYAMWTSAAAGRSDRTIAGMNEGQIAAYYFGIMVVGHLAGAWDAYVMGFLVRSGRLSAMLLRPMLPLWEAMAENLAYKLATFMFVLPAWAIFALIVRPKFEAHAWQVGLAMVSIVLAGVLNFLFGYVTSLVAFWSPKLDAVGEVYFGLCMFLGGRIAPIDALPGPIASLARPLPFRWMFAFPAELLMGRVHGVGDALAGIGVQVAWVAALAIAFRVAWAAAVKHYSAVSG